MMRGWPLAARLAVLLAGAMIVVLLVAGFVVNRAATRSLDETLGPRDEQRLALAAAIVEEGIERGVDPRGLELLLRRVARQSGLHMRVTDADGDVIAEAGRRPGGGESVVLDQPLSASAGGGALEVTVRSAQLPFLRGFNAALVIIGLVAVVVLGLVAVLLASRLTRPLRAVAAAAHRLGEGDLGARATGGPDAESEDLAAAFNGMADRLERSELLRRRAASDLAHDLATPATVLESQLQAMVDSVVPADAAQLEKARAAASGLSGVIAQLGELTQAESAPLHRRSEQLDLQALAREAVSGLGSLAREHDVALTTIGDSARADADRGHLTRALTNVITNAVQHSRAGGTVEVRTGGEAGRSVVRVTDSGPGIAGDDLPYVFERFYRADRSRGRHAGSGIGLTVARELVAANGGTLEVETTGPQGTTMLLAFPQA